MPSTCSDFTTLIRAWGAGDRAALDHLVEAVYPELHAIALRYIQRERTGHTLQCTALIHEAYLRLVKSPARQCDGRAHFFGFAAHLMRGILVDHARARSAAKRGSGVLTITTSEPLDRSNDTDVDILDLHAALEELERRDALQSRLVELRYFGGLSIEEAAEVLGLSRSTVKREWIVAKTWLYRRLTRDKARP